MSRPLRPFPAFKRKGISLLLLLLLLLLMLLLLMLLLLLLALLRMLLYLTRTKVRAASNRDLPDAAAMLTEMKAVIPAAAAALGVQVPAATNRDQ